MYEHDMNNSSIHSAIQMARPRETRQVLGQWVRLARQRLGLTQPLLASKSGVSVATLSRLEREGQGGVDNLLRVLQALGELTVSMPTSRNYCGRRLCPTTSPK